MLDLRRLLLTDSPKMAPWCRNVWELAPTWKTCWTYDLLLLTNSVKYAPGCRNMYELAPISVFYDVFYCILIGALCWLIYGNFRVTLRVGYEEICWKSLIWIMLNVVGLNRGISWKPCFSSQGIFRNQVFKSSRIKLYRKRAILYEFKILSLS